jgi:hypothetical protein
MCVLYSWSCFSPGYDGGTSDSDDGTTAFSDVSGLQHPTPKFWLILQVKDDSVDMYYHSRLDLRLVQLQYYQNVLQYVFKYEEFYFIIIT